MSGKTVYRGMGVEGVAVEVQRLEGGRWFRRAGVRSGYHGSFVLRLPPGQYRFSARTALPAASGGSLLLQGTLERLEVGPRARRIDRLLLGLAPSVLPQGS